MATSECKFCENLELCKFLDRQFAKDRAKDNKPKIYHERTVALVTHSWTKAKGKRRAGRTTDYRNKGLGYKLNYCPECGRYLRRKLRG